MDNNEMGKKMTGKARVYAICTIVLGAALLFSPYSVIRITAYAAGAVLIALGGTALIPALRDKDGNYAFQAVASAAAMLLGISTFISPYWFIAVLPTAAGFVIVLYGAGKLKEISGDTIDTIDWKKAWPYIACTAFGFILLMDPFGAAAAGARVTGAVLILSGILGIKEGKA